MDLYETANQFFRLVSGPTLWTLTISSKSLRRCNGILARQRMQTVGRRRAARTFCSSATAATQLLVFDPGLFRGTACSSRSSASNAITLISGIVLQTPRRAERPLFGRGQGTAPYLTSLGAYFLPSFLSFFLFIGRLDRSSFWQPRWVPANAPEDPGRRPMFRLLSPS